VFLTFLGVDLKKRSDRVLDIKHASKRKLWKWRTQWLKKRGSWCWLSPSGELCDPRWADNFDCCVYKPQLTHPTYCASKVLSWQFYFLFFSKQLLTFNLIDSLLKMWGPVNKKILADVSGVQNCITHTRCDGFRKEDFSSTLNFTGSTDHHKWKRSAD